MALDGIEGQIAAARRIIERDSIVSEYEHPDKEALIHWLLDDLIDRTYCLGVLKPVANYWEMLRNDTKLMAIVRHLKSIVHNLKGE